MVKGCVDVDVVERKARWRVSVACILDAPPAASPVFCSTLTVDVATRCDLPLTVYGLGRCVGLWHSSFSDVFEPDPDVSWHMWLRVAS